MPDLTAPQVDEFVEHVESTGASQFVRVPLEMALARVHEAFRRSGSESLPQNLQPVVRRLRRLPDPEWDAPGVESATVFDAEEARELLSADVFESWVLDLSELYAADLLPLPYPYALEEVWLEDSAEALAEVEQLRERLVSMCRHMALWYHYDDTAGDAEMMVALAEQVEDDFTESLLVREMLRKTVSFYEHRPELGEQAPMQMMGDQDLRFEFHQRFPLGGSGTPEGEREFRLDLTELAFHVFEFVRPFIPNERQPRFEEMIEVAGELGALVADAAIAGRDVEGTVTDLLEDVEWLDGVRKIVTREAVDNVEALLDYYR